jgi:hypothetical protein
MEVSGWIMLLSINTYLADGTDLAFIETYGPDDPEVNSIVLTIGDTSVSMLENEALGLAHGLMKAASILEYEVKTKEVEND